MSTTYTLYQPRSILTPDLPSVERDQISFHFKRGLHVKRFDLSRRLVDPELR